MRRSIRIKAILILVASGFFLGVSVHLVHGFQVQRTAGELLEEADQAEAAGQTDKAIEYLDYYLGLKPRDFDAMARYGMLLTRSAKTPLARVDGARVLEKVLLNKP